MTRWPGGRMLLLVGTLAAALGLAAWMWRAVDPRSPAPAAEERALGSAATEPIRGPIRTSTPAPARPLPAAGVEATIGAGEAHEYALSLAAGEYVELVAEQSGIDLVLRLASPTGEELARVDALDGAWGPERLIYLAREDGEHRLRLEPWAASGAGRYRLSIEARRPPSPIDRERLRAATVFRTAEALGREGESAAMIAAYREASERWRALGDDLWVSAAELRLGRALSERGDLAAALVHLERALALAERAAEDGHRAGILASLARAYRLTGEPQRALAANRRALELYRRLGDLRGQALASNNLAVVHGNAGRVEQALEHSERALELWEALGEPDELANALHNIGALYSLLGRNEAAVDFLERALALRRADGDARGEAVTLTALGWVSHLADDGERAVAQLERALALRRTAGDARGEAATLDRLGTALAALERRDEARAAYRRAERLLEDSGDVFGLANTLANLGKLADDEGRPRSALEHYARALPLLRQVGDRSAEAETLVLRARAERALGNLDTARLSVGRALRLIETQHHAAERSATRAAFLASRYDAYELAIDLEMELDARRPGEGWARAALETSERARARGLLQQLSAARPSLDRQVDARLLEELGRLVDRIAELEREPIGGSEERELRETLLALDRVRAEIRRTSPGYAAFADPRPLDLAELGLDEQTAILYFALGAERSFVWLLGRDRIVARELPARREIEALARRVHRLLAASDQRAARTQGRRAASELGELLLGPLAGELTQRRLVLVADGALHYVPFAALGQANGELLGARHELVRAPSLAVLAELERRAAGREPARGLLAVIADPLLDPGDPRLDAAARRRATGAADDGAAEIPAALPHTAAEAEAILSLVPAHRRLAALGAAADRELVTSGRLGDHRIVHFATHGRLDSEHPELSAILLSRFDAHGRPLDGRLRAHELYDLELGADLVVLSACQTALGKELRGEGLVGLTGGLMYAGATQVMVSLWRVSDRATAELMRRFYRALLVEGLPPAVALRRAQRSMAAEPRWSAPSFWAGFVLLGDRRTIIAQTSGA